MGEVRFRVVGPELNEGEDGAETGGDWGAESDGSDRDADAISVSRDCISR